LQIIGGSAKGVPIMVSGTARPYLAKTRGAIFNSLCADIPQARVLDLYAGSGSVGIEALSRGAEHCTFVERDKVSAETIKANLIKCRLEDRARIMKMNVSGFCQSCSEKFDVIFLDPPFPDNEKWNESQENIDLMHDTAGMLSEDGVLVFRFEFRKLEPPQWAGLELKKDKTYGRSRVLFYSHSQQ